MNAPLASPRRFDRPRQVRAETGAGRWGLVLALALWTALAVPSGVFAQDPGPAVVITPGDARTFHVAVQAFQDESEPAAPAWVFGPVWTLLYALMGLAAFRIWERRDQFAGSRRALLLFVGQLVLNAMWTPVFFGQHEIGLALVILVSLWVTLLATLRAFRRIDRTAGMMLVPYILWVSFAVALNAAILRLN